MYLAEVGKRFAPAVQLADRHYSRRKPGSPQFMPPGQTMILIGLHSVFGWWRPHPDSGIVAMNGYDGWTCSIFRNEGPIKSSALILEAEQHLSAKYACGPSGMLTYVWDAKIKSVNPGYCFKCAGWALLRQPDGSARRSADGKKTLLWKPFQLAGVTR